MSTHVKHMGFELEAAHAKIVGALEYVPPDLREDIVKHLKPKKLQDAVRDTLSS